MPHTTEVLLHLTVILVLFNHVVHINSITVHDDLRDPIVHICDLGWLRGRTFTDENHQFYGFLGVKYAEAPTGKNRFKAPVPVKPWEGILSAENYSQNCSTHEYLSQIKSAEQTNITVEDCLTMDIYTPSVGSGENDTLFPVMFYIHGGTFSRFNSADYKPDYIMTKDVVLVVPNFRVDALGFLSTKTDEIPGNAGELDVLLALKWVKERISDFSGDPNQITVFSLSSGAVMASALVVSPLTPPNLFQQLILESASVLGDWAYALDPVEYARDIAQRANPALANATIAEINAAFIEMPISTLLEASNAHYLANLPNGSNRVGARSLTVGGPSNFLPDTPQNLIDKGFFLRNLSLVAGVVENEGTYLAAYVYAALNPLNVLNNSTFTSNFLIPTIVTALGEVPRVDVTTAINEGSTFFAAPEVGTDSYSAMSTAIADFMGTIALKQPVFEFAKQNAKFNPQNTYLYTFNYHGKDSIFDQLAPGYPYPGGICHGDELKYLFPSFKLHGRDRRMSRTMVDLWTSFAMDGVPNTNWPPLECGDGPYLVIDEQMSVRYNFTTEYKAGINAEA